VIFGLSSHTIFVGHVLSKIYCSVYCFYPMLLGVVVLSNMHMAISITWHFFCVTTPFCQGMYVANCLWMPYFLQNLWKSWRKNSLPLSIHRILILLDSFSFFGFKIHQGIWFLFKEINPHLLENVINEQWENTWHQTPKPSSLN